jgi:hypothetical protein
LRADLFLDLGLLKIEEAMSQARVERAVADVIVEWRYMWREELNDIRYR